MRGLTLEKAAEAMSISKGQYVKLERGERRLTADYIVRAADAFGVTPSDIIGKSATVPLVGYVGAGQYVEAINNGGIDEVDAPADANPDTVAAIVRGESMLPLFYDGWVLYWSKHLPPKEMINKLCVVQLANGQILVKYLRPGSQAGLYTLTSTNANDMTDQLVDWAAPIDWIKPR